MEIDTGRLLQAAIDRDWTYLSAETHLSPTRLAQLAMRSIDDPAVIAQYPVQCRILASRRDQARRERSWGM